MDENLSFENFEEVWSRVTASDEASPELPDAEPAHTERLCLVKPRSLSCAVRFLPRF